MDFRQILISVRQALPSILTAVAVIGGAILVIMLLPGRTAAVILGIAAAAVLIFFLVRNMERGTQIALLWLAIGVSADAAYAKVNDQAPLTIANALVKLAEAFIKLGDILIKSVGLVITDGRGRGPVAASVAPEFVWAFILALILFLAMNFFRSREA